MNPVSEPNNAVQQLGTQILQKIFGEAAQRFDLAEGTVIGNTDVRVIYLSSDLIHAIYDTLKYQAGDAWSLILKNCGLVWGKRVALSLEKEVLALGGIALGELGVDSYIALLERYFANHGWGKMRFSLADAENHGIVRASLANSLFAHTLAEVMGPVDYMVAGMLQSLFAEISGQDLQCEQIAYNYSGKTTSEFVISGAVRVTALTELDLQELTPDEVLAGLRFAG
jgi:predicted hydrocarbon binding protein